MRKKRHRYTIQAEINVVPFLDILLILLVIFMMVPAQFFQSFEVNLPNSTIKNNIINNNNNNHNQSILTIEIKETGLCNISMNNRYVKSIHVDQLHSEIHDTVYTYPKMICLVAAAKNVQYDTVMRLLNTLNSIGIYSVGMLTYPVVNVH